jgi:hypothetical protein
LNVQQAWRIYEDEIDLMGAGTLMGALKLFAERYGVTIKCGDQVGRFIPWALVPPNTPILVGASVFANTQATDLER